MKRKSEQLPPTYIRSLRKNKTTGCGPNPRPQGHSNCSFFSEIVASSIVSQIVEQAHQKIKVRAHEEFIEGVVRSCELMAANLQDTVCPELHEMEHGVSIVIDTQPERVAFDPICGFDKLVTMKNDVTNRSQESSLVESKIKPFGVFQNGKKLLSQKSTTIISKLVPLDSISLTQTKSEKESEKQESFYRDRIYDSGLPMLVIPQYRKQLQKTSKLSKLGFQNSKQSFMQDCVFDYNGQKNTLSAFSKLASITVPKQSTPSNVLRTTYRVVDPTLEQRKKMSLSKNRNSANNLTEMYRISKEIIKNPNIRNERSDILENSALIRYDGNMDQGEIIKGMLEASFRDKAVVFRSIDKTQRKSKIL